MYSLHGTTTLQASPGDAEGKEQKSTEDLGTNCIALNSSQLGDTADNDDDECSRRRILLSRHLMPAYLGSPDGMVMMEAGDSPGKADVVFD